MASAITSVLRFRAEADRSDRCEGFDDARLDTLILALPVSWKRTLIQYAGRLHRLHPGKQEVRIFDYVDCEVPVLLRMFQKRQRGYRGLSYAQIST
jgi:superfamily II DNA or RNA helicase